MSITEKPEETPERLAFYRKIDGGSMTPLWAVFADIITPEPQSGCRAHLWHYPQARDWLLEAGGLITAKEAERRVLILENPGLRGESKITTSLYAGLQLVLPGEVAPAHRHSQSALRFVLDGAGGHTAVNGERTEMNFGDFVITPPWAWHDHGNHSDAPMIWLDGLDIPMAGFFDASFAQAYDADEQPVSRASGDSNARYGANMLPVDFEAHELASPIFNYPYARSREALEAMRRQQEWDPCHGLKMRYVNPVDGGFAMPTIAPEMDRAPRRRRRGAVQLFRSRGTAKTGVLARAARRAVEFVSDHRRQHRIITRRPTAAIAASTPRRRPSKPRNGASSRRSPPMKPIDYCNCRISRR